MNWEHCQIPAALTLTRMSGVLFVVALSVIISPVGQAQPTPQQKARQMADAQWGSLDQFGALWLKAFQSGLKRNHDQLMVGKGGLPPLIDQNSSRT